jgi:ribosome-binding protein aMBF1 (putative translation factor)
MWYPERDSNLRPSDLTQRNTYATLRNKADLRSRRIEMNSGNNYFERRLARRLQDPGFRSEYDRASRDIEQTIAVLRSLDARREAIGISKAELARKIGKRPEVVRRLFSAGGNPELNTVTAMAAVLGGEIQMVFSPAIVPNPAAGRTESTRRSSPAHRS